MVATSCRNKLAKLHALIVVHDPMAFLVFAVSKAKSKSMVSNTHLNAICVLGLHECPDITRVKHILELPILTELAIVSHGWIYDPP